ncbi:MAG: sugar transferase, partial [Candidatus Portnoybacteria bacterium]|nr:sugar transferase [Candidatus Portnoybacteria bacterium]
VLYLSLWFTLFIRYGISFDFRIWQQHFWPFTIIYLLWLTIFYIAGLYELTLARNSIDFYSTLLRGMLINIGLAIAFFYFIPYFGITPKTNLFLNLVVFALLFSGWRQLYNHSVRTFAFASNVLIIGKNKEIDQTIAVIKKNPQLGYKVIKHIGPEDIQTPFDLLEMATQKNIKTIITAIDPHKNNRLVRSLYQCLPLKISFSDLPSFYEKILGKVPVSGIGEIWFLENLTESRKNFYEAFKRVCDMSGACIFGAISLIFYPFIALAIKIDSKGPVFYKQIRTGQDGQIFKVIKFRSMIEEAEKDGAQWANQQDHRITRVGKFMRKTRIDELPQLWNVL